MRETRKEIGEELDVPSTEQAAPQGRNIAAPAPPNSVGVSLSAFKRVFSSTAGLFRLCEWVRAGARSLYLLMPWQLDAVLCISVLFGNGWPGELLYSFSIQLCTWNGLD